MFKEIVKMRVMLTSCGLETKKIEESFLEFLGKVPEQADALFYSHSCY